jgi:hypothetical protein
LRTVAVLRSQLTPLSSPPDLFAAGDTSPKDWQPRQVAARGEFPPARETPPTRDAAGRFSEPGRTPTHTLSQSNVSKRSKADPKKSHFRPQLPNEAGTPHFSKAHPVRTATAVPLREFKENQSVRKKVTAEKPIFNFSAMSKTVYTWSTAARFLVVVRAWGPPHACGLPRPDLAERGASQTRQVG